MLAQTIGRLPEPWRALTTLLLVPVVWIPRLQSTLIGFFFDHSSGWTVTAKYALLAFPTLLGLTAVWCTQLSLYTLPFRSRRVDFISTLLVTWWTAAVAVLMYWVGIIRLVLVLVWWLITFLSLVVELALEAVLRLVLWPISAVDRMTKDYFRPSVPWIAVGLLVLWCALEAVVFTATVLPVLAQGMADLVGNDSLPRATGAIVWVFLFLLAMGSFICIQVLIEAVKRRAFTFIVLSVLVELFVMFFEVVFLYRGLAEALTPWIVQQTGDTFRPSAWFTLSMARFGWTAVRGMAWFLFGQYGTPPLLRLLSRQPIAGCEDPAARAPLRRPRGHAPAEDLSDHRGWLLGQGHRLLEYVGLPVLNLIAAALNFAMAVIAARPLFRLPFKGLMEALEPGDPGLLVTSYRASIDADASSDAEWLGSAAGDSCRGDRISRRLTPCVRLRPPS